MRKKEPSSSILFLDKNIIDPDEINMTDIYIDEDKQTRGNRVSTQVTKHPVNM